MDLERYRKLKAEAERLRREHDRAVGAAREQLRRLKDEFGCGSLEEAQRKAKRLKVEADKLDREFDDKLAEFEAEWAETLGGRVRI